MKHWILLLCMSLCLTACTSGGDGTAPSPSDGGPTDAPKTSDSDGNNPPVSRTFAGESSANRPIPVTSEPTRSSDVPTPPPSTGTPVPTVPPVPTQTPAPTTASKKPETTAPPKRTTAPATTSAPPATSTPPTPPTPPTDPDGKTYRDDHSIVYATEGAFLLQDGQSVEIGADFALIRTGIGEDFDRVLWQGKIGYVPSGLLTDQMPQSVATVAKEKGGIYYKGPGPLVAIDAGHQNRAMNGQEPLGPGSTEMKNKLSSGTQGVATRLEEYKLNLSVALLLRDELIGRGYSVLMIRESNDVRLSNADRAKIANAYNAAAFIRIHANGSDDSLERGAFTLCQTPKNPYNGALYEKSRALAEDVLSGYLGQTGFSRDEIWETDTMTGINWATVPVTLIEMGYMSNPEEDRIMATEAFQKKAAAGMADGIDAYFARKLG